MPGRTAARGQRGGSSLNDDVDVVWELLRTDDGTKLKRMFSRVSWLPEEIDYVRHVDPVRFVQSPFSLPPGTLEVAALLDRLGLPPDVSGRIAAKRLRDAGHSASNDAIYASVKHRKFLAGTSNSEARASNSEARSTPRSTLSTRRGALPGALVEHLTFPLVAKPEQCSEHRGALRTVTMERLLPL